MRQPASAAHRGGAEEGAAGGEPGRVQLLGPGIEQRVDRRRERRVLGRVPPIALHEREQDVLAAQAGEQLVGRGGLERVDGGVLLEDLLVVQPGTDLLDPVVDERGIGPGGDRHAAGELRAERGAGDPDHGQHRDRPDRGAVVPPHQAVLATTNGCPPRNARASNDGSAFSCARR